jgi:hypothetical protein
MMKVTGLTFEPAVIGPYETGPATCKDHDPRASQVAERVGHLIVSNA